MQKNWKKANQDATFCEWADEADEHEKDLAWAASDPVRLPDAPPIVPFVPFETRKSGASLKFEHRKSSASPISQSKASSSSVSTAVVSAKQNFPSEINIGTIY